MPTILAQVAAPTTVAVGPGILLPALALAAAMFCTFGMAARIRRQRQLAQGPRFEAAWGPASTDPSAWPKALVCVSIGAVVPVVALALTTAAYVSRPDAEAVIWIVPVLVGSVAVVSGGLLAGYLFSGPPRPKGAAAWDDDAKTGVADPDLFDVAGRRG